MSLELNGAYRTQAGLTLIEILVVMFLIGLATSIAVMTLPDQPDPAETQARQLIGEFEQMRTTAILTGQPVGLYVDDNTIETKLWLDGMWKTRTVSDPLPFGTRLSIERDTRRGDTVMPEIEGWPQLVFDPTGVTDPVRIRYRARGRDLALDVRQDGEVVLVSN